MKNMDLFMPAKRKLPILAALLLLAAASYLTIMNESARITTFEECENAGLLVRYIRVYDGNGPIEKECVLWSGKRFEKQAEPTFGDDSENKPCSASSDCRLPASYALRSDCPYEMRCREDRCTVICPWRETSLAPFFPTQKEPAASQMQALLSDKQLTMEDGCLRAGGYLLVWPYGFSLSTDKDGTFQVINSTGQPVARAGNKIKVGGGADETPGGNVAKYYSADLPSDRCPGPYWIVGEVLKSG